MAKIEVAMKKKNHTLFSGRNGLKRVCPFTLIFAFLAVCFAPEARATAGQPQKSKIIVGGELDYPPYSFIDDKENPTGFSTELTRAIAHTMGMDIEIKLGPWPDIRRSLEEGEIDIIQGMFYSEERAKTFDFSPPFSILSESIFARENSPAVHSIDDLRGKELIVMRGEAMHDYVLKQGLTDRILLTETPDDALRLLASGKGDYALGAQMPGLYWIRELKLSNITTVGPPLEPFENCYVVQKGNAPLLSRFTEGLNIIKQTGEYRKITDKWLGVLEPNRMTHQLVIKYAAAVVVPLILLLAVFVVWSWMLRVAVHKKTKELKAKSDELENYFTSSLDLLCIATTDGRFIRLNPEWEAVLGYPLCELEGRKFLDFVHPDDLESTLAAIEQLIAHQEIRSFENRYRAKDGSFRWIEWRSTKPLDKTLYAAARDITSRKKAEEERLHIEEQRKRTEKMESLAVMAGGVAHDLNNVLGVIIGYADLVLDSVDKKDPIRSRLEIIMKSSERAAHIVQDLLTLARRNVSSRDILNLNDVVNDLEKSPELEKLISYNPSISIRTELDPNLLNISGSCVHLSKTIFNLVSNAAEAMPSGGQVTIRTANQYLDVPVHGYDEIQEGEYAVLSVSDRGEGILPNDMKRIFEPFYTKKVMGRSGTGLGLSVVWGTVQDHNGYINVQNEKDKGSVFTLYFPITRQEVPSVSSEIAVSEYMGSGETVLIVDDIAEQRELAAEMLSALHYKVKSVSSGEEALAYLRNHKADLLILDMIMDPGMDGLDTYRNVLQIHPRQRAIIVSGFSETQRVAAAQSLGAGDYVRKPYIREKLGMAVRKELDKSGAFLKG
jgi:PAS domain S-box-containing protein